MMERIKRAVGIKAPPSPVPPDPNYTYNVWMLNGYCQKNSEFQDVNVVRYYNASIDPVQPNSICPVSILDTRYMLANGNGTAGVSSFNGRTGAVTVLPTDITPVTKTLYAPLTGTTDQVFFSYSGEANFTVGGQTMDLPWTGSMSLVYGSNVNWNAVTSPAYLSSSINLSPQNVSMFTKSGSSLLLDRDVNFVSSNSTTITSTKGNLTIGSTSGQYVYDGLQATTVTGESVIILSNNQNYQGSTGCLSLASDNTGTALTYSSPLTVWTANSLLTRAYADTRYSPIGSGGGGLPQNGNVTGPIQWTITDPSYPNSTMHAGFGIPWGIYFDNSGYPNQSITGFTVPNKGMADKWYAPKVSALTGRDPVTTEVQLGDKFLQIEEGRIVGVISAAEREAWTQETDELIRKRGQ